MRDGKQRTHAKVTVKAGLTLVAFLACLACQRPAARTEPTSTTTLPPASVPATPQATPAQVAAAPTPHALPRLEVPDPYAWAMAMARVEEVRGTRDALSVPAELEHYEDRRRFLAVQMADAKNEHFELPHDQGEIALMALRGELVELKAMGDDYLLYEVGTDAIEDPLAHYDVATGKDVPLFASLPAYEAEDARLAAEMEGSGRTAATARTRRELLAHYYGDPHTRDALLREYHAVDTLATNFGGAAYDLSTPRERARFQVRLSSFVRPEARDTVLELARAYHARFDRLLPVTSLIRSERYQRRLARGNPNATHVDIPPHCTGMAFDISYKFMAHDEQNFVMEQVASLERAGRVEALRERRNHIHVYTLAEGRPPEPLVAGFLADVQAAHVGAWPGEARTGGRKARSVRRAAQRRSAIRRARARRAR